MKNNTLGWKALILSCLLFTAQHSRAQDDLMKVLEEKTATSGPVYTTGTFKGTRLINGHTVETRGKQELDFIISHRFGTLNSGAYHFFGLDQAYIRLGLDYGITDRLNVGIGRSSYQKTFDGFVKYKLLQQRSDVKAMPFSAVLFLSSAYQSENSVDPNENRSANDRMTYVSQLLLARKFSQKLSLQLTPTVVHRNFAGDLTGPNTMVALGVGGRYKLTRRTSLNAEYYYRFLPGTTQGYYNSLALGVDIETGGHVFQFHLTNSRGMIERAFITDTTGDFFNGDIHLGFNISRTFQLGKKKKTVSNEQ